MKKNKSKQPCNNNNEDDEVEFCGLAGQEAGLGDFGVSVTKGEDLRLIPVSPGESGLGRPYAPENWPEPGDTWRWKVGKRTNQSWFKDRYLYLPERLQKLLSRNMPFDSKTSLNSFLESQFPGIDTSAFFASFVWRIPPKVPFTTASKGGSLAGTHNSCIMQHKHAYTTRSLNATLDKINNEVTNPSPPHCHGESRTSLICNNSETQERGELSNFKFGHYMEIIWNELPEEKKKYSTCLDPSNFLLYGNEARKGDVVGWIKKRNVTSKRYVIIPSVEGNHWRLFIICHSEETVESSNRIECLLLLDSLQARKSRYLFEDRLRRLITDVYGMPENGEKIKEIPLMVPKVPQQTNGRDCGYFVLYYIKLFIESAPEIFSRSSYPYFMSKNWFCPQQVERFFNTLDQHHDTSISDQELTDVSAGSSIELIQLTDTGISDAHGLS
ncbi:hypothetical protein Leryth_010743 [Lithospermum erythrorhizon]|nr:hypothetical protein Leryth_010743 [Lithospermum erythrorhizon]